jgi:ribonuclease HI
MPPPPITIYTDGACIGNPGPGGYGVVLIEGSQRREFSGGFAHTTNSRMEIFAAIVGLEALMGPATVTLFSDSKYLVDAVSKGWVQRWHANRWKRNKSARAENIDLWKRLLPLLEKYRVTMLWVKGHAGDPANERCDQLANAAAARPNLPPDLGYHPLDRQKTLF